MQRLWSAEELGERWTLGAEDLALLRGLPEAGKLGLAAQLAYWRQNGRFPDDEADFAPAIVGHLGRAGRHQRRRARRVRVGRAKRPSAPPACPRSPCGRRFRRDGGGKFSALAHG
jgi:hypothetical protein